MTDLADRIREEWETKARSKVRTALNNAVKGIDKYLTDEDLDLAKMVFFNDHHSQIIVGSLTFEIKEESDYREKWTTVSVEWRCPKCGKTEKSEVHSMDALGRLLAQWKSKPCVTAEMYYNH